MNNNLFLPSGSYKKDDDDDDGGGGDGARARIIYAQF
jgi:hypothetical protein